MAQISLDPPSLSTFSLASVQRTLQAQADALSTLSSQYAEDALLQASLRRLLDILFQTIVLKGKLVLCGIGKSHKIAAKMVATLNSLSIQASLLHPSEALHGDLGMVCDSDTLIFVTASGNTPELINLMPHLNPSIPIVLLTCQRVLNLSQHPQVRLLLLAEVPQNLKEDTVHGLPAPTITTTMLLALADAVLLALSEMMEEDLEKRRVKFSRHHPGGAIGALLSHLNVNQLGNATRALLLLSLLLFLFLQIHQANMGRVDSAEGSTLVLLQLDDDVTLYKN